MKNLDLSKYGLDEREQEEVRLACTYVEYFDHGTSGHLAYHVITKLYWAVEELEQAWDKAEKDRENLVEVLTGGLSGNTVKEMVEAVRRL